MTNRLSKSILTFLTVALFTSGVVININAQDSGNEADSLQRLPGFWKDIGVGAGGSIWAAGAGLGIHQWTGVSRCALGFGRTLPLALMVQSGPLALGRAFTTGTVLNG